MKFLDENRNTVLLLTRSENLSTSSY